MKNKTLLSFVIVFTALQNLVSVSATQQSYQQTINGVSYGSNAAACYSTCYKGETCTINGKTALCKAYCGDGIVVGVETNQKRCDDGNKVAKDGCSADCYV